MRVSGAAALVAVGVAVWGSVLWMADNPIETSAIVEQRSTTGLLDGVGEQGVDQPYDATELNLVDAYARPLFSRDRKPWSPPAPPAEELTTAEAPPPGEPNVPKFILVGVSIPDNAGAKALLRRGPRAEPVWLSEGEKLGGWTVHKIEQGSIVVRRGNRDFSLDLYPEAPGDP